MLGPRPVQIAFLQHHVWPVDGLVMGRCHDLLPPTLLDCKMKNKLEFGGEIVMGLSQPVLCNKTEHLYASEDLKRYFLKCQACRAAFRVGHF